MSDHGETLTSKRHKTKPLGRETKWTLNDQKESEGDDKVRSYGGGLGGRLHVCAQGPVVS